MTGRYSDMSDEELGRRLAAELPRHAAPAHLARAIRAAAPARAPRVPWLAPAVAALATALVLGLFFVPALPRLVPTDPTERLVRAVVSEHTRVLMWGARHGDVVPATLPEHSRETGVALTRTFIGDDHLTLVAAEPVYVDRRRGIAIHYRDTDGHLVSYIAVPANGVTIPDGARVVVDRYRPALIRDNGFATWLWRQGEVACLIVSDRVSDTEMDTFKDYFTRLRAATEPLPAY
jgi:anti-sigma factor RsiW